jgi:hypothetical protein
MLAIATGDEPDGIVCYQIKLFQIEIFRFVLFSLSGLELLISLAMR